MAGNQRLKFHTGLERERYSNFVVDLRPAALVTPKQATTPKLVKQRIKKISAQVDKLRFNLLPPKKWHQRLAVSFKEATHKLVVWLQSPVQFNFWRPYSPWRAFTTQREKEFKMVLSALKKSSRRYKLPFVTRDIYAWYRPIVSFIIILVFIIVPFRILAYYHGGNFSAWENNVKDLSQAAVSSLLAAAEAVSRQDFQTADSNFQAASADFLAAQTELNSISDTLLSLARFSDNPEIQLAAQSKKFLAAGVIASSLGRNLVLATDNLLDDQQSNLAVRLTKFLEYGELATKDAQALEIAVTQIDPANLPEAYREQFTALAKQAAHLSSTLESFVGAGRGLQDILGLKRDKRYLLVFQNNAEMRGSGGFLGSYALVDIRQGEIRNLEVPAGGSYDLEAGRRVSVAAPEPLWLIDPLWHFWDANWWPDWSLTAKNLMWFYEKSGGPTVDGVIGVTPSVVEGLLRITGPIDMRAEYGLIVDADNFWETVAQVVERDNLALTHPLVASSTPIATTSAIISAIPLEQDLNNNKENKPKKIIGDLLVRIMEVLPSKLNRESLPAALAVFEDSLAAKHVLFYFTDPKLQSEIERRNWGGEVRTSAADYLLVVNTNIAGQKSDRLMQETINHQSVVSSDGSIINTITITRTHTGKKNEPLTGVRNVDWLRVYVPLGSELLSATGFRGPDEFYLQAKPEDNWLKLPELREEREAQLDEASATKIYQESGKTVFANWLMVDPGETSSVIIKYRLPFSFNQLAVNENWPDRLASWFIPESQRVIPYSLLVQKQPGAKPSLFTSTLKLPGESEIIWQPDTLKTDATGWQINDSLTSDHYWSIIVKKNKQ